MKTVDVRVGIMAAVLLASLSPPVAAQDGSFGRARAGLGVGATVAAIAGAAALSSGNGNACTGSGDYLQVCRLTFLAGTGLGAGLGAIIGSTIRKDAPGGPATSILLGFALGVLSAFLVSLPACSQSDPTNPAWLCGPHGMTQPAVTVLGAAAGGAIGYALGRSNSLEVTQVGPVAGSGSGPALGIAFSRPVR